MGFRIKVNARRSPDNCARAPRPTINPPSNRINKTRLDHHYMNKRDAFEVHRLQTEANLKRMKTERRLNVTSNAKPLAVNKRRPLADVTNASRPSNSKKAQVYGMIRDFGRRVPAPPTPNGAGAHFKKTSRRLAPAPFDHGFPRLLAIRTEILNHIPYTSVADTAVDQGRQHIRTFIEWFRLNRYEYVRGLESPTEAVDDVAVDDVPAPVNNVPAVVDNVPTIVNNVPAPVNDIPAVVDNVPVNLNDNVPTAMNDNVPAETSTTPKNTTAPTSAIGAAPSTVLSLLSLTPPPAEPAPAEPSPAVSSSPTPPGMATVLNQQIYTASTSASTHIVVHAAMIGRFLTAVEVRAIASPASQTVLLARTDILFSIDPHDRLVLPPTARHDIGTIPIYARWEIFKEN